MIVVENLSNNLLYILEPLKTLHSHNFTVYACYGTEKVFDDTVC
jgi:hypothetical protein